MSREFSDMDDKEFDDFLKGISESPDIPFREEDWKLMKAKIAAPSTNVFRRKLGTASVWFGILAILSLGIYFGGNRLWKTGYEDEHPATASKDLKVETGEVEVGNLKPAGTMPFEGKKVFPESASVEAESARLTSAANFKIKERGLNVSFFAVSLESTGQSFDPLEQSRTGKAISSDYRQDLSQLAPLNLGGQGLTLRPSDPPKEKRPEDMKTRKYLAGRFNLSVQAAPDVSGVTLNQLGKAGQAVGLGAEYFLSPSFSINSGVFYSHKLYESNGPFEMAYGEVVNGVIGDCGVLDIPVNLRYYPVQGTVQRAFVSLGLSSYLMLSETYELSYLDPSTGYEYKKTIEKNGENQHPFGVVNLSLGYERKLAQRLSLQVEPYLKVPLDGVGEGNISLKSTGIFLGVKYYPGR